MKRIALAFAFLLTVSAAHAASWKDLASGQHSFKSLGTAFYVDVPVRRIPDARIQLSFVNRELAKELGLDLPTDPVAAEKMLTDLFAWEVDPTGASNKKWFATHYQDSNEKGPGSAQGDGRALWTGELQLKSADGKILYVDGVQKGVGPTPYAWLNNPSHSDGKQNTNELIISGIRSTADLRNQLDSTGDILGFTIQDSTGEFRSMTLRVGRQTRPAHIRYHSDNVADEAKMMDYIVKRDLGLPIEHHVTDAEFVRWERNFARNNAEDTARVYALVGFYEHPTMGNKTTTGGSIDLNGRQYLDAYHIKLTHLNNSLLVGNQVTLQQEYIDDINWYLRHAKYRPRVNNRALNDEMNAIFAKTFQKTASSLFLHSLGLDELSIARLPVDTRVKFYEAVDALMRAVGPNRADMVMHNKDIQAAAFDTRKILKGTLLALSLPTAAEQRAALDALYTVDRSWAKEDGGNENLRQAYEIAARSVVVAAGGRIDPRWIENAKERTHSERYDSTSDGIWDQWAHPIRAKAESGQVSWVEISNLMDRAAQTFVDPQLPVRKTGMLKVPQGVSDISAEPELKHVATDKNEARANFIGTTLPFKAPLCAGALANIK